MSGMLPAIIGLALAAAHTAGTVTYTSAGRAYLDRGEKDGIAPGMILELRRLGRPVGSCRIESASAHNAACAGNGLRVGDSFRVERHPEAAAATPAPSSLPAPLSPEQLEHQRAALAHSAFPKVEFKGESGGIAPGLRASLELSHRTWTAFSAGRTFNQERLDLNIGGAEVGAGFRLFTQLAALHYTSTGESTHYRPDQPSQLYVWQLELSSREPDRSYTLSMGRIWPWHAAGLSVIDGIQAGWVSENRNVEVGVFGGAIPDAVSLALNTSRSTAGAYVSFTRAGGEQSLLRLFCGELRFAVLRLPQMGQQVETEALARASLGRTVDLGADLLFGLGGDPSFGGLQGLRLDLDARPAKSLRLFGSFRHVQAPMPEIDPNSGLLLSGRSQRGDLTEAWEISPSATLSLVEGGVTSGESSLSRYFLGPELTLPRLFGQKGGASAGYQEERGWISGRTVYVQSALTPIDRLQLVSRLSYFADVYGTDNTNHSLGLFLSADARVQSWLSLRLSLLARQGVGPGEINAVAPSSGLFLSFGAKGEF